MERASSLPGFPWIRIADILARTSNRTEVILDASDPSNAFYRVGTPRQP